MSPLPRHKLKPIPNHLLQAGHWISFTYIDFIVFDHFDLPVVAVK